MKFCFRIYSEEEEAGTTSLFLKVIQQKIKIHKIFRERKKFLISVENVRINFYL